MEVRGEGEGGGRGRQAVYFRYIITDVICTGYTPLEGHICIFQNNRGSIPWEKQQRTSVTLSYCSVRTSRLENQHSMQSK